MLSKGNIVNIHNLSSEVGKMINGLISNLNTQLTTNN